MNDDLISRQAAIDALGDAHFKNYGNAIMVIQGLPSAYPKKGKWVEHTEIIGCISFRGFQCSECNYWKDNTGEWNYCPICGAYMRGEE